MNKCCEKCIRTYPVSEVYKNDPNKGWSCTNRVCRCHSQEKEETTTSDFERGKVYAGIIVDLYEIRYPLLSAGLSNRQMQSIEELHKYNFFNAVIAQLSDKYEVKQEDIREEMLRRSYEKDRHALLPEQESTKHICCDGECHHDDCCGKVEDNCPLKHSQEE